MRNLLACALCLLLAACVSGPKDFLQKSANNQYFDQKGFHGQKRAPVYNEQYINKAKKNVATGNHDEYLDADDETDEEALAQKNIALYQQKLEQEIVKKEKLKQQRQNRHKIPNLSEANAHITPATHAQNLELKDELDEIKKMLQEAKVELAKSKCPNIKTMEAIPPESTNPEPEQASPTTP